MSFDKTKRFKISKPDLNYNASFLKANGKIFQSVSALSKYIKIFRFGPDYLVIQINVIKHYKLFALHLSGIYIGIV